MTAQATLDRAQSVGLYLHLDDGQVTLTGDKSAIGDLLPSLRQHRAELVQLLSKKAIDQMPPFHIAQPWRALDREFQAQP
jgi:hypothetical protein